MHSDTSAIEIPVESQLNFETKMGFFLHKYRVAFKFFTMYYKIQLQTAILIKYMS